MIEEKMGREKKFQPHWGFKRVALKKMVGLECALTGT